MKPITELDTAEQALHPEFEKMYQEYFTMACAAAYIVLGSREDAKDVGYGHPSPKITKYRHVLPKILSGWYLLSASGNLNCQYERGLNSEPT
jgi:hypothetical protein